MYYIFSLFINDFDVDIFYVWYMEIKIDRLIDMIKENKSNAGNIHFQLQAKRSDRFLCFTLFRNFKELHISLQPDVRL